MFHTKYSLKVSLFYVLLVLLAVFQFQDGYWTYLGICKYGISAEGNPLIYWLLNSVGIKIGLVLSKSIGLFFIWLIHFLGKRKIQSSIMVYLVLINIFYGWSAYRWYVVLFTE